MSDSDRKKILSRRDLVKAAPAVGAVALAGTSAAAAPPIPKKWDYEADVVIVGYGGAGACASIAAADAGAKVILIEKQTQARHIPNTRMAGGIFHSPATDGDKAALKEYAKAMMSGENIPGKLEGEQPEVSDELASVFAERAPRNMAFMQSLDPEFKTAPWAGGAAFPNFPGAKESGYRAYIATYNGSADFNVPSMDKPKKDKMNGEAFYTCLATGVANRKNIRPLFESPAYRLVTNDKGEVIGVIAKQGGKDVAVKARRAVVLTAGGYEYNMAMRKAFLEGPGVKAGRSTARRSIPATASRWRCGSAPA